MRHTLAEDRALGWIIDTTPDARETMQTMLRLAFAALADPAFVRYSNEIIENTRPRDYRAQIDAIGLFGRQYFKFLNNPIGVQRIRTPGDMIADVESKGFVWGACDDAAVLLAAIGLANALRARYRALAFGSGPAPDPTAPFSHVIADLWDGATWCALDVTRPQDMQRPPQVVRTLTLELA